MLLDSETRQSFKQAKSEQNLFWFKYLVTTASPKYHII